MRIALLFFILISSLFCKTYDLSEVYKLSLVNQNSYLISKLEEDYSKEEVSKSFSKFLPQINLEAEYVKLNEFPVVIEGVEKERRDTKENLRVTLEQYIYDREKYLSYKSSKNLFYQKQLESKSEYQTIIFEVINSYIETILKAEQIELLGKKLEHIDKTLRKATLKYKMGFLSKSDYLEVKLEKIELNTQKSKLEFDYLKAKSALVKRSGVDAIFIKKSIKLKSINDNNLDKYLTLYHNNLDLKVQNLKIYNAGLGVSKAISNFEPKLDFTYEYAATDTPGIDDEKKFTLLLKLNLFSGLYDFNNYQQAKISKLIEEKKIGDLEKKSIKEVKNKVFELKTYIEILNNYPSIIDAKEFRLKSTSKAFNQGTKSIIDLLDEQNKYFDKLNKYLEYKSKYIILLAEVKRYVNDLDEEFIKKIDGYLYE